MTARVGRGPAAVLLALVAAAAPATAYAEPEPVAERLGYSVATPAEWTFDAERSNAVSRGLQAERHYGGLRTDVGADAYVGERASLFVQWVHARDAIAAGTIELAMRRTFDQIRGAAAAGELVSWREDVRPDLAEGHLEWKDAGGDVFTLVRALVFVTDDDLLRQVRAECVFSVERPGDRDRCKRTLESLELTEATGPRGSIGAVPGAGTLRLSPAGAPGDAATEIDVATDAIPGDAGDSVAPDAVGDVRGSADAPSSGDRLVLDAPSIAPADDEGSGPPRVLYQAPADRDRPADRTHQLMTLIGGILVAAAVYAMIRERRRKADFPDEGGADDRPPGSPLAPAPRDRDS